MPETLVILGIAAYGLGDFDHARSAWLECTRLAALVGDPKSQANALNSLGSLAHEDGHVDRALNLYQESLAISEQEGIWASMALAQTNIGFLALERGDIVGGKRLVQDALLLYDNLREAWGIASCLSTLAEIAVQQGQLAKATRLFATSMTFQTHLSLVAEPGNVNEFDHQIAALRYTFGDDFQTHWNYGAALTVDEAVAAALYDESADGTLA